MGRTLIHQEKETLDFPISQVWSVLSAFGAIKTWMPTIEACEADGDRVGAVRTVWYGGTSIQERLEVHDPQSHTVAYRMLEPTGLPLKGAYGTVSLEAADNKTTRLTWTADAEEVDEQAKIVVRGVFEPFIKISIVGLTEALSRPAQPIS